MAIEPLLRDDRHPWMNGFEKLCRQRPHASRISYESRDIQWNGELGVWDFQLCLLEYPTIEEINRREDR